MVDEKRSVDCTRDNQTTSEKNGWMAWEEL